MTPQFLIIDADDTLWENNIYFERAFDEFVEFLDHSTLAAPEIRAVLDAIEEANAVMGFAERILECPMETIAGVPETLAYLAARHDLTLFTKGHPDEQTLKIGRSGLGEYFRHTAIVKEKDAAAYRRLVAERGMDPARTWMIGNSPKSDINPALAAGLHAVFVPHAHTWVLEKQEIAEADGRLLVVDRFEDLHKHF